MTTVAAPIPDLLRRFISTRHRVSLTQNGVDMQFETNDTNLLAEFCRRSDDVLTALGKRQQRWRLKLVRDYDAPAGSSEAMVVAGSAVTTVFLGAGTVVGIDYRAAEILGFVAPEISPAQLFDLILDVAAETATPLPSQAAEETPWDQRA